MTKRSPFSHPTAELKSLREVHHRIKNDLQGIAGLLEANAYRAAPQAILDAVVRLQALAHVHGLQMTTHAHVPAEDLIRAVTVGTIALHSRQSSLTIGSSAAVTHSNLDNSGADGTAADDQTAWQFNPSDAVSVALVIAELIMNACRHSQSNHPIRASIDSDDQGLAFTLRNAGLLPPSFNFSALNRSTHGLGLVKALLPRHGTDITVQQADADVIAKVQFFPPAVTVNS